MGKMAMKDAESQNVEYKRSWHDNGDTQGDTQGDTKGDTQGDTQGVTQGVTQDSGHWEVVSVKGAV